MPQKGDLIKKIRKEKNITQTELAEAIGVSKQTMYKYENNIVSNIPSDKIELIAKKLNISPGQLMGWKGYHYYYYDDDNNDVTNLGEKFSVNQNQCFSEFIQLTSEEQKIIEIYRNYNDNGKDELSRYAEYLSTRNEYKKCPASEQNIG